MHSPRTPKPKIRLRPEQLLNNAVSARERNGLNALDAVVKGTTSLSVGIVRVDANSHAPCAARMVKSIVPTAMGMVRSGMIQDQSRLVRYVQKEKWHALFAPVKSRYLVKTAGRPGRLNKVALHAFRLVDFLAHDASRHLHARRVMGVIRCIVLAAQAKAHFPKSVKIALATGSSCVDRVSAAVMFVQDATAQVDCVLCLPINPKQVRKNVTAVMGKVIQSAKTAKEREVSSAR